MLSLTTWSVNMPKRYPIKAVIPEARMLEKISSFVR